MIIAVWGNNGAGKSTVAIKLANAYARKGRNVVLLDTDFVAPQINVWFPRMDVNPEASLRIVLDNAVTVETVAAKISMVKGRSNYGVMGYTKGYTVNQVTARQDTAGELLNVLSEMADTIIVDCQSNILLDILSLVAIDKGDERVVVMTPDVKGLSWYESNVRPMQDGWENKGLSFIRTFNKVTRSTPAEAVESVTGSAGFYLPYTAYIDDELYSGTLGEDGIYTKAKPFARVLESLASEIDQRHADAVAKKEAAKNQVEPPKEA